VSVIDILTYKSNVFSQNGEDGIIEYLFQKIGSGSRVCCEFGAWDGIHFSNCRNLILHGWESVMIEGDPERYKDLVGTYASNPQVRCVDRYVDTGGNRLDRILRDLDIRELDFLSIDIDGLDYQILEDLTICPRVICIEVSAGHEPASQTLLPTEIARRNIGQPLGAFVRLAEAKGYDLVCYTGNAIFVRREVGVRHSLVTYSPEAAYRNFLDHLTASEREWLYLVNRGQVDPYYRFGNVCLERKSLGISAARAAALSARVLPRRLLSKIKR